MSNYNSNRLQFVHCDTLFESRKAVEDYIGQYKTFEQHRPSLYAEPMVFKYGTDAEHPNIVLAIGANGTGEEGTYEFFLIDMATVDADLAKIKEQITDDEGELKALKESLETLSDDVSKHVEAANKKFDELDQKDEDLYGFIQEIAKKYKLLVNNTDTVNLSVVEDAENGTTISADVKVTDKFVLNSVERENLIQVDADGLKAFVDLSYNPVENRLTFQVNGKIADIDLPKNKFIEGGRYDIDSESLIFNYNDGEEFAVELNDLLNEWGVKETDTIRLTKETNKEAVSAGRDKSFQDILSADLVISEHDNNALVIDDSGVFVEDKSAAIEAVASQSEKAISDVEAKVNELSETVKDIQSDYVRQDTEISNVDGNIITRAADKGIYANVTFNYDAATNTLVFNNGSESGEQRWTLNSAFSLVSAEYDSVNEALVMRFLDARREEQTVSIDVQEFFTEVNYVPTGHSVSLNYVRNVKGHSELSADVVLSTRLGNLLKEDAESHALYVEVSTSDVKDGKEQTLKDTLNGLDESIGNLGGAVGVVTKAVSDETERAETKEKELEDSLNSVTELSNTFKSTIGTDESGNLLGYNTGEVHYVNGGEKASVYENLKTLDNALFVVSGETDNANTSIDELNENLKNHITSADERFSGITETFDDIKEEFNLVKKSIQTNAADIAKNTDAIKAHNEAVDKEFEGYKVKTVTADTTSSVIVTVDAETKNVNFGIKIDGKTIETLHGENEGELSVKIAAGDSNRLKAATDGGLYVDDNGIATEEFVNNEINRLSNQVSGNTLKIEERLNGIDKKIEDHQIEYGSLSELVNDHIKESSATFENLHDTDSNIQGEVDNLKSNLEGLTLKQLKGSDTISISDEYKIELDVVENDPILYINSDGLNAAVSLSYDKENKSINLIGKNGSVFSEINVSDFIVDGMLDAVELDDKDNLKFTFNTESGKQIILVDLSKYIDVYTAGNGISVDGNVISAKVKEGDSYITVTVNGIESKGIDTAISNAVSGATEYIDTKVDDLKTAVDEQIISLRNEIKDLEIPEVPISGITVNGTEVVPNASHVANIEIPVLTGEDIKVTPSTSSTTIAVELNNINQGLNTVSGNTSANTSNIEDLQRTVSGITSHLNGIDIHVAAANTNFEKIDNDYKVKTVTADTTSSVSAVNEDKIVKLDVKIDNQTIKTAHEGDRPKLAEGTLYVNSSAVLDGANVAYKGDIADLAVDVVGGADKFIQSISQTSGKIHAIEANLNAEVVTATPAASATTSVAVTGNTVAQQIASLAASIKSVETNASEEVAGVTVSGGDAIEVISGRTISLVINKDDKVLSQSDNGLLANISLEYGLSGDTEVIKLVGKDGDDLGHINASNFIVDGMLESVVLDGSNLKFTFNTDAGGKEITINLADYIKPYSVSGGLTQDTNGEISVKFVDPIEPEDKYFTVSNDGISYGTLIKKINELQTTIENLRGRIETLLDDGSFETN